MNAIQKLDGSLVWKTIHPQLSHSRALQEIESRAIKYGWMFVKDESLFGGYYVDNNGDCYRVA